MLHQTFGFRPVSVLGANGMEVKVQIDGQSEIVHDKGVRMERTGSPYQLRFYFTASLTQSLVVTAVRLTGSESGKELSISSLAVVRIDETTLYAEVRDLELSYEDYVAHAAFTVTTGSGSIDDFITVHLTRAYSERNVSFGEWLSRL